MKKTEIGQNFYKEKCQCYLSKLASFEKELWNIKFMFAQKGSLSF